MSGSGRSSGDKTLTAFFIVLTILGVVWVVYGLGAVSGNQQGRSKEAASRHESDGKQQAIEACRAEPITSRTECVYDTISASEDSKRAEQDLQAQQGMHFWTISMVFVGILQTGVAGAALWFLREDLRQNRRSSETQLRAYLDFDGITLDLGEGKGDGDRIPCKFSAKVKNFGQTPTTETLLTKAFYMSIPSGEWVPLLPEEFSEDNLGPIPQSDHTNAISSFDMPHYVAIAIQTGATQFKAYLLVEFEDVFGCEHSVSADYVCTGFGKPFDFVAGTRKHVYGERPAHEKGRRQGD